jgi:dTDP-4-amino-4,6-dideoxygalactose transaminase
MPLFKKSIETGKLTYNDTMREFEERAAKYLGVTYCVAVGSCTAGLMLSMRGLGLTGEVIMPSFTFSASGLPVVWNNLKPVFADIDPDTFTIDPVQVEKLITKKTSAIYVTHVFGVIGNVDKLQKIAKKYNLKLIFDAAHAFGSARGGVKAGNFGDVEVFSLSPTKVLTAGEGGLVATNNKELAEYVAAGRNYGDNGSSKKPHLGLSARMSEFHAAIALLSLKALSRNLKRRIKSAEYFKAQMLKVDPRLKFQKIPKDVETNYKDLSVYIDPKLGYTRDELNEYLEKEGVITRKYFFPSLHTHVTYAPKARVRLPHTEQITSGVLSLPLYSHISKEDIDYVVSVFKKFIHDRKKS